MGSTTQHFASHVITPFSQIIHSRRDFLVDVRRHLHRNPELSGYEKNTTQYLARLLQAEHLPIQIGPEDRGIIVDLGDPAASRRIALRADIDAIPVNDVKSVDYRSTVENVMHACGHDAHSTMLLGALILLKHWFEEKQPEGIAVRAIFQPEEETARGAQSLIRHGVLEQVSAIIGSHVDPTRPVGTVGVRSGIVTAHCDEVIVEVSGVGGHGARPHETVDPIAAAVQFINAIYASVNRRVDSQSPVVLSFGYIQGGHSCNVIPDRVQIFGTLRTLGKLARQQTMETVSTIAAGIGAATGAGISVDWRTTVPSIFADQEITHLLRDTCVAILGEDHVNPILNPSMGAEDFAFYTLQLPAAFVRVGCAGKQTGHLPLHNSGFDIDEAVLPIGAQILSSCAVNYLTR
jgi:amidohydrolase